MQPYPTNLTLKYFSLFFFLFFVGFFVFSSVFVSSVNAATLNVIPFTLGKLGSGTSTWTTVEKYTGSYSVDLMTTSTAGDYSYMSFNPVLTIDDITSLSFYYKHVSDGGWAGPRISILINNSESCYLAVSGAATTSTESWKKADGITGGNLTTTGNPDQVWWYGTINCDGSGYSQQGGPVSFADVKTVLDGNILNVAVYMGVVGQGANAGEAYVDDVEVNGVTYYGMIQDAIDTAVTDDTIDISAGTYDEQVVITKGLTLQGTGDDTIIKPSSADKLTTVLDGKFYDGTTNQIAGIIVTNVADGSNVIVKNLKVDGSSVTVKPTGVDRLAGIFYRETGGVIDSLTVVNVRGNPVQVGKDAYGIYLSAVTNEVSVEVKGSALSNYDKNGINAIGNKLTANIHNNIITGRGPLPDGDEVQNGVLVAYGATGTVNTNIISNMAYTPEKWWSAGILFYNGASGSANGNTITDCQMGVIFDNSGGSAQGNTINGGTVGLLGLWAQYYASGIWTVSFTENTVTAANDDTYYNYENAAIGVQTWYDSVSVTATINDNQLIGNEGTTADGIYIGDVPSGSPAGTITATITDNEISGWVNGINFVSSAGSGSTVTGNTISSNSNNGINIESAVNADNIIANNNIITGNTNYGINNGGTETLNAKSNWWGNNDGPVWNNQINGSIYYSPWCTDQTCTEFTSTGVPPTGSLTGVPLSWQKTDATISLSCSDTGGSGCDDTKDYYCTDTTDTCDPTTAYIEAVTISSHVYFRWKITDNVGNINTGSSEILVDKIDPTADISGAPTDWVNIDQTATVTCSDTGGSGCKTSSYAYQLFDTNPGTCPSSGYIVGESVVISSHKWVCSYVEDNAGNLDVSDPVEFKVDKIKPTVILSDDHADTIVRDADTVTITATFTETNGIKEDPKPQITITNTNTTSGCSIAATDMTKTSNLVWMYAWNVPAGCDGTATVSISAQDNAGNTNTPATGKTSYTIDNTPPTITLNGPSSLTIDFGSTYTDQGATATDLVDGNLTSSIVVNNPVNTTLVKTYTITYNVKDTAGNDAVEVTRTVTINPNVQVTPNQTGIVLPTNNTVPLNLSIPLEVTNATLILTNINTTDTIANATLTAPINVTASTSAGDISVVIPSGITITGNTSWDGTINLLQIKETPKVSPTHSAGKIIDTVTSIIEIGFGDIELTFDKAVRILIPGKADQFVGYGRGGNFYPITTTCWADDQTSVELQFSIEGIKECKRNVGPDLVVWTKHFTEFITYTETTPPPPPTVGAGVAGPVAPYLRVKIINPINSIVQTSNTSVEYPVRVENMGIVAGTFSLSISGMPSTWYLLSSPIAVNAGKTGSLSYTLNLPADAYSTSFTVMVNATGDGLTASGSYPVDLRVIPFGILNVTVPVNVTPAGIIIPTAPITGFFSLVTTPTGYSVIGGIAALILAIVGVRIGMSRRKPWRTHYGPSYQEQLVKSLKNQIKKVIEGEE